MNLPINCAKDMSRNYAATWIFVLYVLNAIDVGTSIKITITECDTLYDMDIYNTIDVAYSGAQLSDNPCWAEFTKTSSDQYLCISGSDIRLSCDTSLEYHSSFVKNYIEPEVKMLCNSTTTSEWCPSQYRDNVFIVIRKPSRRTSDDFSLRVYLKDVPEDDSLDNNFTTIILACVLVSVVVILLIGCLLVIISRRNQKARAASTQVVYQTTSGTMNVQTGQASTSPYPATGFTQPNPQMYPPVQQGGLQGNYNVHPMQSAYPAQQATAPVNQTMYSHPGNPGQHYSSAPPMGISSAPPSYDSLVSEKR